MLADKVEIGDYVNYPVYYDNVNGSTLKGWRVISKNIDLDGNPSPGTVNLVSAGVPLTYYHYGDSALSVENLTTNFLETPFTASIERTYRQNGFLPYVTLTETFTNKYTKLSGDKLQVRAMKAEDIFSVTGLTKMEDGNIMDLKNKKYNKLFRIESYYFVASLSFYKCLYYVLYTGEVRSGYNYSVYRDTPSSFSKLFGKS